MDFTAFLLISWMSFLMALTGAMSPGPLFTYTIIKSMKTGKKGYLMGFWIILGHSILEILIIILLLAGFSSILQNPVIIKIIGVIGSLILLFFGTSLLRDIYRKKIPTDFLEKENKASSEITEIKRKSNLGINNPVIGGIFVSMGNPYWWVWWATVGLAFMVQYDVSFSNYGGLIGFFLGHEMGDLIWYVLISCMAFFGRKSFNRKIYYGILAFCGLFMIGFGLYLGISPFFQI